MSQQAMIDLLTHLSNDHQESQEFKQDPDRAMAGLDLTGQERELLRSGNREGIQQHLGGTTLGILGVDDEDDDSDDDNGSGGDGGNGNGGDDGDDGGE